MLRPFSLTLRLSKSIASCAVPAVVRSQPLKRTCFLRPQSVSHLPGNLQHARLLSAPTQPQEKIDEQKPSPESDDGSGAIMASLNEADQRRFKIILLEFDVFFSTGTLVPENMTQERWQHIFEQCHSVSSRKKMYKFWFKLDKTKENEQRKKAERQQRHQEREAEYERLKAEGIVEYPSRILLRVLDRTMTKFYYSNLAYAMMHGLPLVFDLQYNQHMRHQELMNMIEQILMAHGVNKIQREPFHLMLCNAGPDNAVLKHIVKHKVLDLDTLPITVCEKSTTDLFPKKDIVYLSPNAREVMERFDPHSVYVIGGIVDKAKETPLTFAQAKKDQVRTLRLPIDEYLDWKIGSKSLTLDQMMKIMLDIRNTNDWNQAFASVPRRKLHSR